MELGFVPLVGWGVFIDAFKFSVAFSTLSANGWVCAPILLVVWPKAFQHWILQVVGWGQVLLPKCRAPVINIPWGLCYPFPFPHSDLQLTFASTGDLPRPLARSSLSSYGGTALCLVPVHMRPCVPHPRVESLFPQTLWSSCTEA